MTNNIDLLARTIDNNLLLLLTSINSELKTIKTVLSKPASIITVQSSVSDHELGRRLGSIIPCNNKGEVFWFDDFEGSYLYWTATYETTGSAVSSLTYSNSFDQSWKLTNDGLDSAMTITKPFPFMETVDIGFEISIMPDPTNTPANINLYLRWYDGTNLHEASMRWQLSTGIIRGYKPTNVLFTAFSPGIPDIRLHEWYKLKVAASFDKYSLQPAKYLYMNYNGKQIDLSDKLVNVTADVTAKHIEAVVYVESGATGICYIDDAIITVNES